MLYFIAYNKLRFAKCTHKNVSMYIKSTFFPNKKINKTEINKKVKLHQTTEIRKIVNEIKKLTDVIGD